MTEKTSRWKSINHVKYRERKEWRRKRRRRSVGLVDQWARISPVDRVVAPDRLYLFQHRSHTKTTDFLSRLRKSFARSGVTTVVDMSHLVRLMPGGTLLFFSEINRLKYLFPNKSFKFVRSNDDTVNQVLEHVGIYSLAGFVSGAVPTRDDVITWRTASSVITDGKSAGELIETYDSLSRNEIRHIFKGVSEAATNAVEHAYVAGREDGLPPFDESRWWMFCRETDCRLYVGVCDLGVGIPRSLPRTFGEEMIGLAFKMLSLGTVSDDASMILAAMELARTRTERGERGKGLGDMKAVVDSLPGSKLHIFSNRGMVSYAGGKIESKQFENSILGTMIVWMIPIEGDKQ